MLPYSRKDPLPFPFFEAVTALRFSPDYLTRERQEFKEEGKPQVSLPFCPCGGCRTLPRSAERNSFAEIQRKTPRPLGTNTPAQFAHPIYSVQKETEKRHSQRCAVLLIYSIFCAQIMEISEPLLLFSG